MLPLTKSTEYILLFHHNDMDGYVSARILIDYYNKKYPDVAIKNYVCTYSTNIEGILFSKRTAINFDKTKIVIVDFSFNLDTMEKLLDTIQGKKNSHITWIDHHQSIINKYREYYRNNIFFFSDGLQICNGLCATELAYLFTNDAIQYDHTVNEITWNGKKYNLNDVGDRDNLISKIPYGIKTVGDWDLFRWKENMDYTSVYLNKYFKTYKVNPNNKTAGNEYDNIYLIQNKPKKDDDRYKKFNLAIEKGHAIFDSENINNKSICDSGAFPVIINGYENIHTVAINTTNSASMLFSSIEKKYEVGISYFSLGTKTVYSFRRLQENSNKNIDCGLICSTFGGGGHANAAGVTTSKQVFRLPKADKYTTPFEKEIAKKYLTGTFYTVSTIQEYLNNEQAFPEGAIILIKNATDDRNVSQYNIIFGNISGDIYIGGLYIKQKDALVLLAKFKNSEMEALLSLPSNDIINK